MSGRVYAILDESGARVEDTVLQSGGRGGVDVGSAGIHAHEHEHSEFEMRQFIEQLVESGARELPKYVDHYQKKSMQMHNNKYTWFLGFVGLFLSVLLLCLIIRRIRTRWMRALLIRDAERKREKRKVKKKS